MPGKDGLLAHRQIAHQRVEKVTDFLKEGQDRAGSHKVARRTTEDKAASSFR